jgi:hypothetical protein
MIEDSISKDFRQSSFWYNGGHLCTGLFPPVVLPAGSLDVMPGAHRGRSFYDEYGRAPGTLEMRFTTISYTSLYCHICDITADNIRSLLSDGLDYTGISQELSVTILTQTVGYQCSE